MATHSSTLTRRIPWTEESQGSAKTKHKTTKGNNMETRASVKESDHETDVAEKQIHVLEFSTQSTVTKRTMLRKKFTACHLQVEVNGGLPV